MYTQETHKLLAQQTTDAIASRDLATKIQLCIGNFLLYMDATYTKNCKETFDKLNETIINLIKSQKQGWELIFWSLLMENF